MVNFFLSLFSRATFRYLISVIMFRGGYVNGDVREFCTEAFVPIERGDEVVRRCFLVVRVLTLLLPAIGPFTGGFYCLFMGVTGLRGWYETRPDARLQRP